MIPPTILPPPTKNLSVLPPETQESVAAGHANRMQTTAFLVQSELKRLLTSQEGLAPAPRPCPTLVAPHAMSVPGSA
eukprot:617494-Rhodomonas_salina.1